MVFHSRCLWFYAVTLEIVSGNIKISLWFQNFSKAQNTTSFCHLTHGFLLGGPLLRKSIPSFIQRCWELKGHQKAEELRIRQNSFFFMCRRVFFYFTVTLLFIRIPTGGASIKKEEIAAQVFESELLCFMYLFFAHQESTGHI